MSETWLPNLVGGASIWKLASDLNETKFFDGRLLVPETEGSESLPASVRWDVDGLVPLADARAQFPEEVAAAERDFSACLERVAKVFETPQSGFDKYKEAFTIPAFDADGGAHYFYDPAAKKLFVINWGASPRDVAGKSELVFGYQDWGREFAPTEATKPSQTGKAAAAVGVAAAAAQVAAGGEGEGEKKPEEKKKKEEPAAHRPWWVWALLAGVFVILILLVWWLLRACDATTGDAGLGDGGDAGQDASALDAYADGALDAAADDGGDDGGEAGAEGDGGDASVEAGQGDASAEAGDDAGAEGDGGEGDGGPGSTFTIDDDEGGGGGGASGGGGGGKVTVVIGPGGGTKAGARRRHVHPDAKHWRIVAGKDRVSRTEERGDRFDVFLAPGRTFQGVRVEWQDKAGTWHTH